MYLTVVVSVVPGLFAVTGRQIALGVLVDCVFWPKEFLALVVPEQDMLFLDQSILAPMMDPMLWHDLNPWATPDVVPVFENLPEFTAAVRQSELRLGWSLRSMVDFIVADITAGGGILIGCGTLFCSGAVSGFVVMPGCSVRAFVVF